MKSHIDFFMHFFCVIVIAVLILGCNKENGEVKKNDVPSQEIIPGNIYHIDMENKSLYDLFMIESLQGNVNRISPFIWVEKTPLVEYDGPGAMVDRSFWLNTITTYKKIKFTDPFQMVTDFSSKISGCVIYENTLFGNYVSGARKPQPADNLIAKLNATAMLCAHFNAVALTREQYNILTREYGIELPIMADTSTGAFNNWHNCYKYICDNFNDALNKTMMANNSHYCLGMFDYLIKNKMFIINLKGDPSVLEQNLTDKIFDRCVSPSPVFGVWNVTGGEPTEDTFQKYINKQGKYSIVSFEAFNLSFTSGLPAYVPEKSETITHVKYDPNKKYICFTETDGDNYEFIQQIFPLKFEVANRGKYPIGWEIPSTLCELDPIAAKWFYTNIEQNCFVNPVTGAGYNKYPLPQQHQAAYFELTEKYMKTAKYRTIRAMGYKLEEGRLLTDIPSVEGVFCGYGGHDAAAPTISQYPLTHEIYNGKPVFINYSFHNIEEVIAYTGTTPAFFSIACVYTNPKDIMAVINRLLPDWVVVSPAEMVDVYLQYAKQNNGAK